MRSITDWYEYAWREGIEVESRPAAASRSWKTVFQQVGQKLQSAWVQSREPRIWNTPSPSGLLRWNAYDPTTGRSIRNTSEEELRIWLEERYYSHPNSYQKAQTLRTKLFGGLL